MADLPATDTPPCDPDWTLDLRGLLPGTHTTEELDLHSQGLTWQEIHTMTTIHPSPVFL